MRVAALVTVLVGGVGLAACGGGSSSTAPSSTTTSPSQATAAPRKRAKHEAGLADNARSFIRPGGDNSIPNYGMEAGPAERRRATAALARYLRFREEGDWAAVCRSLRGKGRAELMVLVKATKGRLKSCAQILNAFQGHTPSSSRESPLTSGIASLRVRGRYAFALFHGANDSDYVMPMEMTGKAWKVTEIAPVPYPVGTQKTPE